MTYANNKNIPFVILVGENEMQNGFFTIKNMLTGEQQQLDFDGMLKLIVS